MSESRDQSWEADRLEAITSLLTKLEVIPGRNSCGQIMADWVGDVIFAVG